MKKIFSKATALLLSGAMIFSGTGAVSVFSEESAAAGVECESLYAEWQGSGSYAAYYKSKGDYIKVDDALIRTDGKGGYRVEVLGLKGGVEYTIKVVPIENGSENEAAAFTFVGTPESYDRSGYAHFKTDNNPGAYLWDGTLPANANVIYVNESNKDTVKLGKRVGIADIISEYNKGSDPLVIRIIGTVTPPNGVSSSYMMGLKGTAGITIEGVGTDSGLYKWGFSLSGGDDVEFRNLHIDWNYEDGIEMQNANHVWVHNNTFTVGNQNPPTESDKDHGDGSCDAKRSDYVTISYNHFKGTAKTCLLGSSKNSREDVGHYSYHHNFWDGTEQRCPRVRWHDVHVYNNYYKNVGYDLDDPSKKIGYGVGATCNSSIFAENNYFENTYRPLLTSDKNCSALSANDGGVIKAYGNFFDENSTGMEAKDYFPATDKYQVLTAADYTCTLGGWTYDNFDTSSAFYKDDYFLETAQDCVATVLKYAGTKTKTDLTLTNAINGNETGSGDNTDPTSRETTEITTSAVESTTNNESTTEVTTDTTTEHSTESTTAAEGELSDDYGYYFYNGSNSNTPLNFGGIFNADKEMNISRLAASVTTGGKTYQFSGVAGFANGSTINFTVEKKGTLRLVSTSGSTSERKMVITNSGGENIGELRSGTNGTAELVSIQLDPGSYTVTNKGGGEAKLFYIGFSAEKDPVEKIAYGNADLSGDGAITANDSAIVLQYTLNPASIETDADFVKRCDVDGIEGITANDSAMILQKALVSSFVLPVEK